MNKLWFKSIAVASLMGMAPSVLAQSYSYYNGPVIDYNFIYQEPDFDTCNPHQLTSLEVAACFKGINEGRQMAQRFAGGMGRLQGYLTGYSQGLRNGVGFGENDIESYNRGQSYAQAGNSTDDGIIISLPTDYNGQVVNVQGALVKALEDGKNEGLKIGRITGEQRALSQFESAMGSGKAPNKNQGTINPSYSPVANAYTSKLGGKELKVENFIKDLSINNMPLYHTFDPETMTSYSPPTIFDLWGVSGVYSFEKVYWNDARAALATWFRLPDFSNQWATLYNDSEKDPVTGQVIITKNDSTGLMLSSLQNVFADAFAGKSNFNNVATLRQGAYPAYSNFYFSKEFHQNVDQGYNVAQAEGLNIGKLIATDRGFVDKINSLYNESAKATFSNGAQQGLTEGYNSKYNEYYQNSILRSGNLVISDENNNGIFEPGERIRVSFKLDNRGYFNGRDEKIRVSIKGDVTSTTSFDTVISPLTSKVISHPEFVAKIDPSLNANTPAKVILVATGLDSGAQTQTTTAFTANNKVQFAQSNPIVATADVTKGSTDVEVRLQNLTRQPIEEDIHLQLRINGIPAGPQIPVDNARSVSENFIGVVSATGLNPMDMLRGTLRATVELKLNQQVIETINVDINSKQRNTDMIEYFHALLTGKGARPENKQTLKAFIISQNQNELISITKGNPFKKNEFSTIVGKVAQKRQSAVGDSALEVEYHNLANAFSKDIKKIKWGAGRRAAYKKVLKKISYDGKKPKSLM